MTPTPPPIPPEVLRYVARIIVNAQKKGTPNDPRR